VGLALAARLAGIGWGLPQVYEEATPLRKAWAMWGFEAGRGFDPNPHFFKYPSFAIDLQVISLALVKAWLALMGQARSGLELQAVYFMDPTPFYLAGRVVTAVLGALTVWPAYGIAKRAGGLGAALLAGLLVALSVPLIAKSQVIEVDVPLALFVTLAVALAVRLADPASARPLRTAIVTGVAAGLAASTKYPGAIALVPALVAAWLRGRADRTFGLRGTIRAAACIGVSMLAAFFLTSPYVVLDHATFSSQLAEERQHMVLGHFGSAEGATWLYYARAWFTTLLGPVVGVFALAGLTWFGVLRRAPWALIVSSCVVPFMVILCSWTMRADRYILAILPLALVAAAVTLYAVAALGLARRSSRAGKRRLGAGLSPRVSWALGIGLAALLLVFDLPRWAAHARQLGPDSRTLALRWVEANVPAGSLLAVESYGPPLVSPISLSAVDRELFAELRRRGFAPPLYGVLPIPMFQVVAERSAALYDPRLYRGVDFWIVSASVRDRYRGDPARFRSQVAFYDTLATRWIEVARFAPSTGNGAPIFVYRNPNADRPFALRTSPPPEPRAESLSGPGAGGVAYFYYAYGLTEEAIGSPAYALVAYRQAARCPPGEGSPGQATLDAALRRAEARAVGSSRARPSP
jgi:hypothetical protein